MLKKLHTYWPIVGALILLAGLTGCEDKKLYQQQSYVFGTLVELSIYGEDEARAQQAAAQVFADFDRLHHALHAWKPGVVARMNQIFANSPARAAIAPGMIRIINDTTAFSNRSDGLFNPAIGKLVALWGFHSEDFKPVLPNPHEIQKLVRANPTMNDIVIEGIEFYGKNPNVQLDLGGYAKGYALDVAASYLREQGIKNALINIGGNILALGTHGNRPWRVGIQHPRLPKAIATLDLYNGEAIGTSGDYQRYFTIDGKRYCHIIDPRTGYPAQNTQAVTVLIAPGPNAGALSDATSKPLFIEGAQGLHAKAAQLGVTRAMLIDQQGVVHITRALKARLKFEVAPLTIYEVS